MRVFRRDALIADRVASFVRDRMREWASLFCTKDTCKSFFFDFLGGS